MARYEKINLDEASNLRSDESFTVKSAKVPAYLISINSTSRLQWDSLVAVFAFSAAGSATQLADPVPMP